MRSMACWQHHRRAEYHEPAGFLWNPRLHAHCRAVPLWVRFLLQDYNGFNALLDIVCSMTNHSFGVYCVGLPPKVA